MKAILTIQHLVSSDEVQLNTPLSIPADNTHDLLVIGVSGVLEGLTDLHYGSLTAPFMVFVHQGNLPQITIAPVEDKYSVWILRFQPDFFPDNPLQLNAFLHGSLSAAIHDTGLFDRMVMLADLMSKEASSSEPNKVALRSLMGALLAMADSLQAASGSENEVPNSPQQSAFRTFIQILEENFRKPEGVEFYADRLSMTSRNLNLICQNVANRSVFEIIEERRMLESKKLLASTDKPISEIGYEVGYNEKACFTSVFKKKHGQTPSAFRRSFQKRIS